MGHEGVLEGEQGAGGGCDQELDGTHLKGEHQGWDRQQDAEAEGGEGETQIVLCWGRQGNQHDWHRHRQWLLGPLP